MSSFELWMEPEYLASMIFTNYNDDDLQELQRRGVYASLTQFRDVTDLPRAEGDENPSEN
ncbi:MAG: hypothetical protein NVS1B10_08060 [Candidatus Saccharimonadales bacterium]